MTIDIWIFILGVGLFLLYNFMSIGNDLKNFAKYPLVVKATYKNGKTEYFVRTHADTDLPRRFKTEALANTWIEENTIEDEEEIV